MSRGRQWTPKEEEVLRSHAIKYGTANLSSVAKKLHRTETACKVRIYTDTSLRGIYKDRRTKKPSNSVEILEKEIKNNPGNLRQAFKNTAEQTNLTARTIQTYYYMKRENSPMYRDNIKPSFCLIGKTITFNRKNFNTNNNSTRVPNKLWNNLLNLFKVIKNNLDK